MRNTVGFESATTAKAGWNAQERTLHRNVALHYEHDGSPCSRRRAYSAMSRRGRDHAVGDPVSKAATGTLRQCWRDGRSLGHRIAARANRALSAQTQQRFGLTVTEAKWPSGDRHFHAIAISRWDNEGGATGGAGEAVARAGASFTSATARAANFGAHTAQTTESDHEAGTPGAPKDRQIMSWVKPRTGRQ